MSSKSTMEALAGPGRVPFVEERSPCVGICDVFEYCGRRFCGGCGRSVEEIAKWPGFSEAAKRECREFAAKRLKMWYDDP
jgi:predicted Fe-S protein YdhL (DUF1289 family)